tara:strand:+ start:655 stop:1464 length:810 start_codon:yes stop_codon:yes gene_type:complete
MKIACVQIKSTDNLDYNIKKILKYIHICIKKKADFIITPEATTFLYDDKNTLVKNSFAFGKDIFLKTISGIAKKYNKWILIGSIFIKEKKNFKNRSILFNPNGKIEMYYDKINLFDAKLNKNSIFNESKFFKPGNKLKIANLPWGKLGMAICFDLRFPEIFREYSKKNCSFISIPSAFTKLTGKRHWLTLLKARAIENFCYIFAPNQIGKNTKKWKTFGHSVIISPDGKILKINKFKEGVIFAKIDLKLPKKLRNAIPSLKKKFTLLQN